MEKDELPPPVEAPEPESPPPEEPLSDIPIVVRRVPFVYPSAPLPPTGLKYYKQSNRSATLIRLIRLHQVFDLDIPDSTTRKSAPWVILESLVDLMNRHRKFFYLPKSSVDMETGSYFTHAAVDLMSGLVTALDVKHIQTVDFRGSTAGGIGHTRPHLTQVERMGLNHLTEAIGMYHSAEAWLFSQALALVEAQSFSLDDIRDVLQHLVLYLGKEFTFSNSTLDPHAFLWVPFLPPPREFMAFAQMRAIPMRNVVYDVALQYVRDHTLLTPINDITISKRLAASFRAHDNVASPLTSISKVLSTHAISFAEKLMAVAMCPSLANLHIEASVANDALVSLAFALIAHYLPPWLWSFQCWTTAHAPGAPAQIPPVRARDANQYYNNHAQRYLGRTDLCYDVLLSPPNAAIGLVLGSWGRLYNQGNLSQNLLGSMRNILTQIDQQTLSTFFHHFNVAYTTLSHHYMAFPEDPGTLHASDVRLLRRQVVVQPIEIVSFIMLSQNFEVKPSDGTLAATFNSLATDFLEYTTMRNIFDSLPDRPTDFVMSSPHYSHTAALKHGLYSQDSYFKKTIGDVSPGVLFNQDFLGNQIPGPVLVNQPLTPSRPVLNMFAGIYETFLTDPLLFGMSSSMVIAPMNIPSVLPRPPTRLTALRMANGNIAAFDPNFDLVTRSPTAYDLVRSDASGQNITDIINVSITRRTPTEEFQWRIASPYHVNAWCKVRYTHSVHQPYSAGAFQDILNGNEIRIPTIDVALFSNEQIAGVSTGIMSPIHQTMFLPPVRRVVNLLNDATPYDLPLDYYSQPLNQYFSELYLPGLLGRRGPNVLVGVLFDPYFVPIILHSEPPHSSATHDDFHT